MIELAPLSPERPLPNLKELIIDRDPNTRKRLIRALKWLQNYTDYVLYEDTSPWWMQTAVNVREELDHHNSWNEYESAQPNKEMEEFTAEPDGLTFNDLLPASLLRLQALLEQSGAGSQQYAVFIRIHENIRTAALDELELNTMGVQAGADQVETLSPLQTTPVWEILHNPRISQESSDGTRCMDFRTDGDSEQYVFTAVEARLSNADPGESITTTYLFSDLPQAVAVYDTMLSQPGLEISPLYDLANEEQSIAPRKSQKAYF